MKKCFAALLAAVTIGMLLAGCGRQKEETPIRVGLVAGSGSLEKDPLCQMAWEGLEALERDNQWISAACAASDTSQAGQKDLLAFAEEGRELIVVFGLPEEMVIQAAQENPQLHFAMMSESETQLSNLACIAFLPRDEGYLAGLAAGLTTDSGTVGYVQGGRQSQLDDYAIGYAAGVKVVKAKARVLRVRTGSPASAENGQNAGTELVANGADVIYHSGGTAGEGAIAACQVHGVWAIGIHTDQSGLAPGHVLTSTLRRSDTAVETLAREVAENRFQPGLRRLGLAENGITLAPGRLTEEAVKGVDAAVKRIQNGTASIPETEEELEARYPGLLEQFR